MFEIADRGTLFLDEIAELDVAMQAKLLRALQERKIRRVGGTHEISVDVRVIAATNRDLRAMVADGRFRDDLYYRINVLSVDVPPLRERREDIPVLIDYFVKKHTRNTSRLVRGLTAGNAQANDGLQLARQRAPTRVGDRTRDSALRRRSDNDRRSAARSAAGIAAGCRRRVQVAAGRDQF